MASFRRGTDDPDTDFRQNRSDVARDVSIRKSGASGVLIVIGSAVISGLIGMVAFLGSRDRVRVDSDLSRIDAVAAVTTSQVAQHQAALMVLAAQREEMKLDISEIRKVGEENNNLLKSVLLEMKRR